MWSRGFKSLQAEIEKYELLCRQCRQFRRFPGLRPEKPYRSIVGATNSAARRDANRLYFIGLLGGACIVCGFNEHPSALEFDHIDPATKTCEISALMSGVDRNRIWKEVQKCQLLCCNHHRIRSVDSGHIGRNTKPKDSYYLDSSKYKVAAQPAHFAAANKRRSEERKAREIALNTPLDK